MAAYRSVIFIVSFSRRWKKHNNYPDVTSRVDYALHIYPKIFSKRKKKSCLRRKFVIAAKFIVIKNIDREININVI